MSARYHVSPLYDNDGAVGTHFLNDEFYSFVDSWEHAMADPHFAAIIDQEIAAERVADASLERLAACAPTERVREFFLTWLGFIDDELEPWTTGGAIHFRPHWARVLMHALVIADAMDLPDVDLRCLSMAAVFHDSRRKNPYLDTGHGARAAMYYAEACRAFASGKPGAEGDDEHTTESGTEWRSDCSNDNTDGMPGTPALDAGCSLLDAHQAHGAHHARGVEARPSGEKRAELAFDPRAFLAMTWHDRNDEDGMRAIASCVDGDLIPQLENCRYSTTLPTGASADAQTILAIFKDADGLDRVRLGKDGLDVRFLRTDLARGQVDFAHDLFAAIR